MVHQLLLTSFSFNSRPHKEVDRDCSRLNYINRLSIHDLTRRSTLYLGCTMIALTSFNSRPHKEVDVLTIISMQRTKTFQFTTSQGGRRVLAGNAEGGVILSIHDLTRRSTL